MNDEEYNAIVPNSRDATYGQAFLKFAELDHGWSNKLFGHVVYHAFQPKSVIEFGCGTGAALEALSDCGVDVVGVDISAASEAFARRRGLTVPIHQADLGKPFALKEAFDLAISIEVLEHIEPQGADVAVDSICNAAKLSIITACPPVGRNALHLNEQPFQYWIKKFEERGQMYDKEGTVALQSIMRGFEKLPDCPLVPAWYFSSYIGVFRRAV